jgi:hypothetical protein
MLAKPCIRDIIYNPVKIQTLFYKANKRNGWGKMRKGLVLEWYRRFFAALKCVRNVEALLCVLGGADLEILLLAPSDRTKFRARGLVAVVPAIMAFAGFSIGINIATGNLPAALVVGLVWGGIVLFLDVSLLTDLIDAGGRRKACMVLFRGAISAAAAASITSFLLLAVFGNDIAAKMFEDATRNGQAYYEQVVLPQYADVRAAAQAKLTRDRAAVDAANQAVTTLINTVSKDNHRVTCERYGVSGSNGCGKTSGNVGMGQNYAVDKNQLALDSAKLAAAQKHAQSLQTSLAPEMATARATLARTSQDVAADKQNELNRLRADQGLIPHWRALAELRAQSSSVDSWAWILELLLILVDLIAVLTAAFSQVPAYASILQGMRVKAETNSAREELEARGALVQIEAEIAHAAAMNEAERANALQRLEWKLESDSKADRMAAMRAAAESGRLQDDLRALSARTTLGAEASEAALKRQRAKLQAKEEWLRLRLDAQGQQRREEIAVQQELLRGMPTTP